jgi:hypothetical protein
MPDSLNIYARDYIENLEDIENQIKEEEERKENYLKE